MSGRLPDRTRAAVALAFGAAGAASLAVAGAVAALLVTDGVGNAVTYGWRVLTDEASGILVALAPAALAGAASGWRGADAFGTPAPLRSGAVHPDVTRGLGVALWGFVLGCALLPVAVLLAAALGSLVAGDLTLGFSLSVIPAVLLALVVGPLAAVALGSFTVFPAALMLGGLAGWLVGRALGTGAEAGR